MLMSLCLPPTPLLHPRFKSGCIRAPKGLQGIALVVPHLPASTTTLQTLLACPGHAPGSLQPEQTADARRLFKYQPTQTRSKAAFKVVLFEQQRE